MARNRAHDAQIIAEKFAALEPVLDERARRLWAAAEARAIGRGGSFGRSPGDELDRGTRDRLRHQPPAHAR